MCGRTRRKNSSMVLSLQFNDLLGGRLCVRYHTVCDILREMHYFMQSAMQSNRLMADRLCVRHIKTFFDATGPFLCEPLLGEMGSE